MWARKPRGKVGAKGDEVEGAQVEGAQGEEGMGAGKARGGMSALACDSSKSDAGVDEEGIKNFENITVGISHIVCVLTGVFPSFGIVQS